MEGWLLASGLHHHAALLPARPGIASRHPAQPSTSGRQGCPAHHHHRHPKRGSALIVAVAQLERAAAELEEAQATSGETEGPPAASKTPAADQAQKKKRRSRRFRAMADLTPGALAS